MADRTPASCAIEYTCYAMSRVVDLETRIADPAAILSGLPAGRRVCFASERPHERAGRDWRFGAVAQDLTGRNLVLVELTIRVRVRFEHSARQIDAREESLRSRIRHDLCIQLSIRRGLRRPSDRAGGHRRVRAERHFVLK